MELEENDVFFEAVDKLRPGLGATSFPTFRFDPGMEYKNIRGHAGIGQENGTGGGGPNKDDNY